MTYSTVPTTWVESITAAATLALGVLIAGDAYLQHDAQQKAAAELAMPALRLWPGAARAGDDHRAARSSATGAGDDHGAARSAPRAHRGGRTRRGRASAAPLTGC